ARQRQQLKIVLLGFAVMLPLTLTNLLPVYGIHFYPLGNLGNVFFCGTLTYAIVKHRLLDIELILTKTSASVAALILWLTPLWLLTAEVQQQLYGFSDTRLLLFALTVFLLSGLVFPWLLRSTEAWVRRILWGQKYGALQALSMFQKTVVQVLDQEKIIARLREVLVDALQTESVTIYLLHPTNGTYVDVHRSSADFLTDDPFLQALSQQQEPVVREEAVLKEKNPQAVQLATTLAEHGSEVCVPLRTQGRLLGFFFLGKKRNRDIFSSENLQLLSTLGTQVAIALENARLYGELRLSQVMLARSDRLAAVGTLAAGIAHEIRNPLVAVQTFVQLFPERIDDPEFRTTFAQLTVSELERVSTLINDLLTFARPAPVTFGAVQINDLAEQVVRLLAGQAKKKGVTLSICLEPALPPLTVDPEQIKQVFMNLVLNALQATNAGGAVTLATAQQRSLDGQNYCLIEIRDTGEGIRAEHKEEIFNPFFTTKTTGTGLGLFITHQIIKEHGGSIDVESTVGQGTRVLARLPLVPPPAEASTFANTSQEEAKNGASSRHISFPVSFSPPEMSKEIE
ncbi:MAG: GAF domain-containing protein, partial [Deltaproteobacteria bacterium]|nr:GAF domain-containing protein [Deltaproteobacteria bacterium]